jgi:ElaB/YqjD/DUF883 family membrane-anchored ribosome-binding protein
MDFESGSLQAEESATNSFARWDSSAPSDAGGTLLSAVLLQPKQENSRWRRKMDQPRAKENARDTAEQVGKAAKEAVQRVGEQVQPALDQGKSMAQGLATQASETGKQAVGRAGELLQNVAPQAKEVASNLYERGLQSGEYARQYTVEQPLIALLIAGAIGYGLGYLIHRR